MDKYAEQALKEYNSEATAAHPGGVDNRPFWNVYSTQFMYAPAFHFPRILLAKQYLFTAEDKDGVQHTFTADWTTASLAPIWSELPVGVVHLKVESIDEDGKPIHIAGARSFYKSAPFPGRESYPPKARSYRESALAAYRYVYNDEAVQYWLQHGKPMPDYAHNVYPAKTIDAVVRAMVSYAKLEPTCAETALQLACRAADYLLSISFGEGHPLEGLPPTYSFENLNAESVNKVAPAAQKCVGTTMMIYPVSAGIAYLTLAEATGDEMYFHAALRIAEYYKKNVLPCGSWYLLYDCASGKPLSENVCLDFRFVNFFQMLYEKTKDETWRTLETAHDENGRIYREEWSAIRIKRAYAECQPRKQSFYDYGLHRGNIESQKRLAFANIGSWSTKEELPQGIIENTQTGDFLMFQIESNSSWYYEIADKNGEYYLYLGGANLPFGGWSKPLKMGEIYRTPNVALAHGNSLNSVLGEMTKYRRQIAGQNTLDAHLPTIFNEYMHLSWDSPTAEQTKEIAPIVAKTGVEYYVIDCGWHNEEPGNQVYPYVGQWKESKTRFPEGVRKTTDFIRSLGMKAGLWIEPEIIGIQCQEMLDYYDDDCFMQRNGRRIAVMGRYFLDYRNEKVRSYMSETIRRMVEDYGADYIKCDYNEDCGVGTDYMAFCAGEGLEACAEAFYSWIKEMTKKYPQVVFEGCSSGGMRMDYKTLSVYPLISTSDQTDYLKYPYIAGNILSAVIPEQAAVWSYPVGVGEIGFPLPKEYDKEWVAKNISDDRIVMNMVNSFLGRMHLASHLELLNEHQLALVKEGVDYYNSLTDAKKKALPYFPNGFTGFDAEHVISGFKTKEKIYLAVWCLEGSTTVSTIIGGSVSDVKIAYPKNTNVKAKIKDGELIVNFENQKQAVFLELLLR